MKKILCLFYFFSPFIRRERRDRRVAKQIRSADCVRKAYGQGSVLKVTHYLQVQKKMCFWNRIFCSLPPPRSKRGQKTEVEGVIHSR